MRTAEERASCFSKKPYNIRFPACASLSAFCMKQLTETKPDNNIDFTTHHPFKKVSHGQRGSRYYSDCVAPSAWCDVVASLILCHLWGSCQVTSSFFNPCPPFVTWISSHSRTHLLPSCLPVLILPYMPPSLESRILLKIQQILGKSILLTPFGLPFCHYKTVVLTSNCKKK